jgi:hypothetical protein
MLEVVRCENGLSEQERRSVEEQQPMFVATDSKALPMENQKEQK